MVAAMLDGRAITAGELARVARVEPSTASEHLGDLVRGGLVSVTAHGRHRYFQLTGAEVAEALEALAQICPRTPVSSLRASAEASAIGFARTCYDHIAGVLGVAILDGLLAQKWLVVSDDNFEAGPAGYEGFAAFDIDVDALQRQRRRFARPCLDWTVRRPHLAGSLGAAFCTALLQERWVERKQRHRGLLLTPVGDSQLRAVLDIAIDPHTSPTRGR
jgi:DNA-binding MarR family transcriptional regulator